MSYLKCPNCGCDEFIACFKAFSDAAFELKDNKVNIQRRCVEIEEDDIDYICRQCDLQVVLKSTKLVEKEF